MYDVPLSLPEREVELYQILQKIEGVLRRECELVNILKKMLREKKYLFEWMNENSISFPPLKIEPLKKYSIYTDCSYLIMKNGKLMIESFTVSFDDSEPDEPFYWKINRSFFEPSDTDLQHLLSMKVNDEEAFQAFLLYYQTL